MTVKAESSILQSKLYEVLVGRGAQIRICKLREAKKVDLSAVREALLSKVDDETKQELNLVITCHDDLPKGMKARLFLSQGMKAFDLLQRWLSTPTSFINLRVMLFAELNEFKVVQPGVFLNAAHLTIADSGALGCVVNPVVKEILSTWKSTLALTVSDKSKPILENTEFFAWSKALFMSVVSLKCGIAQMPVAAHNLQMSDEFVSAAVKLAVRAWTQPMLKKAAAASPVAAKALAIYEEEEARLLTVGAGGHTPHDTNANDKGYLRIDFSMWERT